MRGEGKTRSSYHIWGIFRGFEVTVQSVFSTNLQILKITLVIVNSYFNNIIFIYLLYYLMFYIIYLKQTRGYFLLRGFGTETGRKKFGTIRYVWVTSGERKSGALI